MPFSHIVTSWSSNLLISLYSPNSLWLFFTFCNACPPILNDLNDPLRMFLPTSFAFSMSSLSLITTKNPTSSTSDFHNFPVLSLYESTTSPT